jgi:hypothetical protein
MKPCSRFILKQIYMFKSYREGSKTNWGTTTDSSLSIDQIQLGAVLRIADAVEKMALRYNDLLTDRDWSKRRNQEKEEENARLRRSQAALRGYIKRLKK